MLLNKRELFLTMFNTINSSPMLVTKSIFKLIFVLSNYQMCTFPLSMTQRSWEIESDKNCFCHKIASNTLEELKCVQLLRNIRSENRTVMSKFAFPGSMNPLPGFICSLVYYSWQLVLTQIQFRYATEICPEKRRTFPGTPKLKDPKTAAYQFDWVKINLGVKLFNSPHQLLPWQSRERNRAVNSVLKVQI